jgi:hypothetical protein
MFTHLDLTKTFLTGCLVASVLACLFLAPAPLTAQTTTNPSTSSGDSSDDGTTPPPPVDEPDEDDVSLTSLPLWAERLDPAAAAAESQSGRVVRIVRTWLAGPCGWLQALRADRLDLCAVSKPERGAPKRSPGR